MQKYDIKTRKVVIRYPNTFVEVEINGQVTGVGVARYNREDERAAAELREQARSRLDDATTLIREVWSFHDDGLSEVVLEMVDAIQEEALALSNLADNLTWNIEVGFNLAYSRAVRDGKKALRELAGPASATSSRWDKMLDRLFNNEIE